MTVKLDLPAETATGNTLSRERSLAQTGSGYKSWARTVLWWRTRTFVMKVDSTRTKSMRAEAVAAGSVRASLSHSPR